MSYHDDLIAMFSQHVSAYETTLGFSVQTMKTNFSISNGDIDILARGDGMTAVIEVKSHRGLHSRFYRTQLPKYRAAFAHTNARFFVLTGTATKSLSPLEVELEECEIQD